MFTDRNTEIQGIQDTTGPFNNEYWERRSHVRGVYLTQHISRMETARMKEEEKVDTRIMQESSSRKSGRKERGTKGKSSKQGLTSAEDLTIELPEDRESPCYRSE